MNQNALVQALTFMSMPIVLFGVLYVIGFIIVVIDYNSRPDESE